MRNPQMTITRFIALGVSVFCIGVVVAASFTSIMPAFDGTASEPVSMTYWVENDLITVDYPSEDIKVYSPVFRPYYLNINAHSFVTIHDPVMVRTFDALRPYLDGLTDNEKADLLHRFVNKNTMYETDMSKHGVREYIQYPSETLLEKTGDCEDTSLLLVTLYAMAGLDSVLVSVTDHVLVGVAVDGSGSYFNTFNSDKRYYAVESTTNWSIGYYDQRDATILVFHPNGVILNEGVLLFAMLGIISVYLYLDCRRQLNYCALEVAE